MQVGCVPSNCIFNIVKKKVGDTTIKPVVNMKNIYHIFLVLIVIQLSKSEIRHCPEAVASVQIVSSCPDSKEAWEYAALKKNCSGMAARQSCTSPEQFKYHCVINGFRNKLVEVCAPKRIIFGHCVEFNYGGGVIQDQMSALCNSKFPQCDSIYHSTEAYKYPDCYALVSESSNKLSTTTSTVGYSDTGLDTTGIIIGIILAILGTTILAIIGVLVFKFKRKLRQHTSTATVDERTSLMLLESGNGQGLRYKTSNIAGRKRSSHSESSAYNVSDKKTNSQGRQRSSHSESSAYSPKVHRSNGYKRTPSQPFIGDLNENEKNENKRTEIHVNTCIPKNI